MVRQFKELVDQETPKRPKSIDISSFKYLIDRFLGCIDCRTDYTGECQRGGLMRVWKSHFCFLLFFLLFIKSIGAQIGGIVGTHGTLILDDAEDLDLNAAGV